MELTAAEQARWVSLLEASIVTDPDLTLLDLERDTYGRAQLPATTRRCVYVVVDHDDHVAYVGMCDRADSTVADRFRDHHALHDDWARVWIIPVRACMTTDDVRGVETTLIAHFDPVFNTQGRRSR